MNSNWEVLKFSRDFSNRVIIQGFKMKLVLIFYSLFFLFRLVCCVDPFFLTECSLFLLTTDGLFGFISQQLMVVWQILSGFVSFTPFNMASFGGFNLFDWLSHLFDSVSTVLKKKIVALFFIFYFPFPIPQHWINKKIKKGKKKRISHKLDLVDFEKC